LAEALGRGELSYAKVRALTRVATPETEARLLGVGRAGTAAHVERIVRGWRCVDQRAEARETGMFPRKRPRWPSSRPMPWPCSRRRPCTTGSNLALLCRRHHRAVHEEGYQVTRLPDGALQFRRPDGRPLPDIPPPAAVPGDPITTLRACHDAQGLHLDARTGCAGWLGERLNVTWAIDVLHPLAQRSRPSLAETLTQSSAGVSTPAGGSSKAP
jgi:hypothetical protein